MYSTYDKLQFVNLVKQKRKKIIAVMIALFGTSKSCPKLP
jgi:hypothetical protein